MQLQFLSKISKGKRTKKLTMWCSFSEASKLLGYKSRSTLYQLKEKGLLDNYLEEIEGKTYLYMRKRNGKTLAKHIRSNVFDRHGFACNDFDPDKYLESLRGL